ncbi:MAG TPA: NnrS family protein [Bdellovibrionales bacterium]|nr:NnrS family protein [Bdellovibrionales bacterium]
MGFKRAFEHPVWLVGFRPFFILAFVAGALLPLVWGLAFWGVAPFSAVASFQWHAHEMLYGFGWAVLAGFLLTASKNWLKIRGLHGAGLALVAALWALERAVIALHFTAGPWPYAAVLVASGLSVAAVVAYVVGCLIRYRRQDTFNDNYFFVIALPLFLIGKGLLLSERHYLAGWWISIGVFRVAFAVMFERTITQFMKNTFAVEITRNRALDSAIKVCVVASIFAVFLPGLAAAVLLFVTGGLLLIRFFLWSPATGLKRFEIAIMYVGYLALTSHFLMEGLRFAGHLNLVGTFSVHVFTFLCMGVVIPGMLIRISQGHTGRKLVFTWSDRAAIYSMMLAAAFRLLLPQLLPQHYQLWIVLAGAGWTVCFTLLGWRLVPFLLKPRIDGKVHA